MRAIKISTAGDASVLQLSPNEPEPKPAAGQVLVKIHAAGVNFIDIYHRLGRYPQKLPFIPGMEAAGVVAAVGESVTGFQSGDRVAYQGQIGGYSEYAAVNADRLIPLPKNFSFIEGAAFPLQALTAQYVVHDFYTVKRGDWVLVHAAAGGVGLLLVQWLSHLGAKVIGTVSTEEKAVLAKEAGAQAVILYTRDDFVPEIKRLTGGLGARLILDGVGKSTFKGDLEAAAMGGHIVVFGSASGPAEAIEPSALMAKSLSLSGGRLNNLITTHEELLRRAREVFAGLKEEWLKLRISHILPLVEASKAHQLLEGRQSTGKIVLRVVD